VSVDVQRQVLVKRPRDEVAEFMFDPANDATWTTGVIAARPLTAGRLRPGSRVERTSKFIGREFSYAYEVVEAEDDRFVEMRVEKPFPMQIRYQLDDVPEGTVVRIHTRGDAKGFFGIVGPLLSAMVGRNIGKDLEQLRVHLERGASL
jgi:hypothetical protein